MDVKRNQVIIKILLVLLFPSVQRQRSNFLVVNETSGEKWLEKRFNQGYRAPPPPFFP